tara:strand:- start:597 stop:1268 length:672 start_codon:yes stop_codon:yes gene_type:complete
MKNQATLKVNQSLDQEASFSGVYGSYTINLQDKKEVQYYRLSVLLISISFSIGLSQWFFLGPSMAWIWLVTMAIGLGGALKWIHIYLKPLHKTLQIFWAIGSIGIAFLLVSFGPGNLLATIATNSIWTIAIGPLFAALTGLGFKEFFCFRRIEALGLTLLLPITLLSHLIHLLNGQIIMIMLMTSALLSLILSIRKFGMEASSDIGDKSVFEYLQKQRSAELI